MAVDISKASTSIGRHFCAKVISFMFSVLTLYWRLTAALVDTLMYSEDVFVGV